MSNNTPLEAEEQSTLVEWMELSGLKFTAIPNATFTRSWKQKVKNTQQGLRAGFPDLVVIIPEEKSNTINAQLVFIEMKRQKGGRVSPEQNAWIESLKAASQNVFVAMGCDEGIRILKGFMK